MNGPTGPSRKFVSQFHTSYQGPQVSPAKAHLKTRAVQNPLTLSRAEFCVPMRQGSWAVPSQGQNPVLLARPAVPRGDLILGTCDAEDRCGFAYFFFRRFVVFFAAAFFAVAALRVAHQTPGGGTVGYLPYLFASQA